MISCRLGHSEYHNNVDEALRKVLCVVINASLDLVLREINLRGSSTAF